MNALTFVGVTGMGKTTLFDRLKISMNQIGFDSTLAITSFYLQNMINYMKLENSQVEYLRYLEEIFTLLEKFKQLEQLPPQPREIGMLLEMFLYNATFEYNLDHEYYKAYDERYRQLGGRIVFLKVNEELVLERSVLSTRIHRGPKWSKYLDNMSKSNEQLAQMFIERQRVLESIVDASCVPVLKINTSEMDWDTYEQQILSFWKNKEEATLCSIKS